MIKIENVEVVGWEHAIRGMRNPMNSWEKSDTDWFFAANEEDVQNYIEYDAEHDMYHLIGHNDLDLMMRLANGGPVHAKYRRMIAVYLDITAPLYWWKEFDTYKVGTAANSCSTMHKIHSKEFTLEDFSCEKLLKDDESVRFDIICPGGMYETPFSMLKLTIEMLNICRKQFVYTGEKKYWWQMIQLLPSSYNQKRTVMLNYEVLVGMYKWRKNHKLDEWREFCEWIESLPYSELITLCEDSEEVSG